MLGFAVCQSQVYTALGTTDHKMENARNSPKFRAGSAYGLLELARDQGRQQTDYQETKQRLVHRNQWTRMQTG